MFTKTLIAAAAVAATLAAALPAQQAEAKTNFDVNVGIGAGYGYGGGYAYGDGYGYGYGGQPYYHHAHGGYGAISCERGARIVRWNGFRGVQPVDCSLPRYNYVAWRHGEQFMVTVNGGGAIVRVRPSY